MRCPQCRRALIAEGLLTWCEGCGYEPPESRALPAKPPNEEHEREPRPSATGRVSQRRAGVTYCECGHGQGSHDHRRWQCRRCECGRFAGDGVQPAAPPSRCMCGHAEGSHTNHRYKCGCCECRRFVSETPMGVGT